MDIKNKIKIRDLREEVEKICTSIPFDFSTQNEELEENYLKSIPNHVFEKFISSIGTEEVTSEYRNWTSKYLKEIKEISKMLGIHVTFVSNRFSCHFLPLDIYENHEIFYDTNATSSIKDKFISKYNLFAFWLPHVLDMDEIMDKYEGQIFGDTTLYKMNGEFQKKVQEYNNVNIISIQDMFMRFIEAY